MRKVFRSLVIGSLLLNPLQISYASTPVPGTKCTILNKQINGNGYIYTCQKSGKTMKWVRKSIVSKAPTTQSSTASTKVISKVGDICTINSPSKIQVNDGTLYCVQISDGSFKYIEHFTKAPAINNPSSPEPLEACETPDLRGPVPPQMSFLAITHNSIVPSKPLLKHSGTLNLLVVPIDFSDVPGESDPSAIYAKDFELMSKWFAVNSNNKLKVQVDFQNNWFRAPLPAAKYDPTLWANNDFETQHQVVQQYINITTAQIDYTKADTVVFVYPKAASNSTGYLSMWNANFLAGKNQVEFSVLSSLGTADKYEPFGLWLSHEMLHSMGLAMHFPANPPGWGVEWGRYSYNEAMLPWNQMILDWINPDQYYCITASNLTDIQLTLVPQESELSGLRTIFIRVSNTEALMVVSYRKDIWSFQAPENFYGSMVALIDTSKQLDWSGESSDDKFDGIKYQRPGVWLHPVNQIPDDNSWTNEHTGEGGALMYLGDVISYKGISVKLVKSENFDTIEISKTK